MALSGIQIYKLLPQTNCKDCGFPTCLAFAMKLAAKQVELSLCPHVSEESQAKLSESAAPPIRLVSLSSNGHEVKAGNEVVLFRHEKTFYHKPGLFVRVRDDETPEAIRAKAAEVDSYLVNYVGIELTFDGFVVEAVSGDQQAFVKAVGSVRSVSDRPLILMSRDPGTIEAALQGLNGEATMIHAADADNWAEMAELAKKHKAPLAVVGHSLDELAELTDKIRDKGVEDLVLDPGGRNFGQLLVQYTQIRRQALKKNFRPLGFPLIAFPGAAEDEATEAMLAAQAIAKYAGFIVLDHFTPELAYPLLVLRENIYTDPQKPIQVQPGLYEINDPQPGDPLLVTTNFSITYFSVANEVEGAGVPAWLLVTDAEGMSVLTAWAAGKFDAERIAKDMKRFGVSARVNHRQIVIPGHVAVISGELEEELPDWEVRVGPREAVDLPLFLKQVLVA
ncbi:MAG: acetyl-CoA decarbonylase/synthase complex subunit gamma [Candidatus Promineifilaceae bacterium]|nr:acetyl-CoA decarbonylase/synthase complex subunit gamma [Candidatus Promineifilaceae bacterium]